MRALVVDDDVTSRLVLQEMLAPYGEVYSCMNGEEAVQAFQRSAAMGSPYELICLDVMMPCTSGIDALREIRQAEQRPGPSAKILMVSSLDDSKTVVSAFREQCDGYLVKPIDRAKLLVQLRTLSLIG